MRTKKMTKNKLVRGGFFFVSTLLTINFSLITFHSLSPAFAEDTTNDNYTLQVGSIDTNPQPTKKPPTKILSPTQILGAQAPKPEFTTGPNYTVTSSADSFSFSLPQDAIDYGILTSTNPVIRTSEITFSSGNFGTEILGYENHPLQSANKDSIQNTSCDNGSCTSEIAAAWNNTLTYGFGYRCDSADTNLCDPILSVSNYFKPYPSDSLSQSPVPVLTAFAKASQNKGTLTYKVNISGTQKTGGYYNSITYLAIPNF